MRCRQCTLDSDGPLGADRPWHPLRLTHEWSCLGNLICDRCGSILPPTDPDDPGHRLKTSQLDRFGLGGGASTLLEP